MSPVAGGKQPRVSGRVEKDLRLLLRDTRCIFLGVLLGGSGPPCTRGVSPQTWASSGGLCVSPCVCLFGPLHPLQ